jgi:hypothetical protein
MWNKDKLIKLIHQNQDVATSMDEAYCLAEDLIMTKPGLKEFIEKNYKTTEATYWLAGAIS